MTMYEIMNSISDELMKIIMHNPSNKLVTIKEPWELDATPYTLNINGDVNLNHFGLIISLQRDSEPKGMKAYQIMKLLGFQDDPNEEESYIRTSICFYFDETKAQAEVDRLNKEKGKKIDTPFEEISFYKKEIEIN